MGRKDKNDNGSKALEEGKAVFDMLFTAFSIILLAFFILLNTYASPDARRVRVTLGSLVGTFGLEMGGANVENEGSVYTRSRAPMDPDGENLTFAFNAFRHELQRAHLSPFVEIINENDHHMLRFKDTFLFERGGDAISPKTFAVLDRVSELVRRLNRPIRIEGHTDPLAATGRYGNWGLSASRANAVMRFLTEAANVPKRLVTAVGRGPGVPVGALDDPKTFERSRRVEIWFP